jgi:hypothetical protein
VLFAPKNNGRRNISWEKKKFYREENIITKKNHGKRKKRLKNNPPDLKWTANAIHNDKSKKSDDVKKGDGDNKSNGDWKKKSERLDLNEATTGISARKRI